MKAFTLIEALVGISIALIVAGVLVIDPLIAYNTKSIVTFTVNDKAAVINDKDSQYLIYTTAGVYSDDDSLWYWKWNSSDVYNQIQRGNKYTAVVYGFREPIMSWYKNIVSVTPAN